MVEKVKKAEEEIEEKVEAKVEKTVERALPKRMQRKRKMEKVIEGRERPGPTPGPTPTPTLKPTPRKDKSMKIPYSLEKELRENERTKKGWAENETQRDLINRGWTQEKINKILEEVDETIEERTDLYYQLMDEGLPQSEIDKRIREGGI